MTQTQAIDVPGWRQRASIDVPLCHPHRQDLLHEQWQRRLGHLAHVRRLRLPADRTRGVHRTRVERRSVGEVAVSRQFSDPIEGTSGSGGADGQAELVAVHIIRSGSLRIEDTGRRADLGPGTGTLCIRDLHTSWQFAYTAPTDCRVLILPRAGLLQHLYRTRLPALTVAPATAPESRLLLAHLDAAWSLAEQLGPEATHAAGEAMAMLLTGLIRTHAPTAVPPQSLRAAATAYADSRLRDPDLAPATISRVLGPGGAAGFALENNTCDALDFTECSENELDPPVDQPLCGGPVGELCVRAG